MPDLTTPGNWRYDPGFGRVTSDAPTPHEGDPMPLATVEAAYKSLEEAHANGRLFASAKALRAALERLDAYLDFGTPVELGEDLTMPASEGLNDAFAAACAVLAETREG